MVKRVISAALALVLLLSAVQTFTPSVNALITTYKVTESYESSPYYSALCKVRLTGDPRKDIVNIAYSQVGYREGSERGEYSGADLEVYNNFCEYNYWFRNYTDVGIRLGGRTAPWCATFISWCARQAHIPTMVLPNSKSAGPRESFFNLKYYAGGSLPAYYYRHTGNCEFMGENYTPQPGDLFFTKTMSHVGIVVAVHGKTFTSVEGNTNENGSNEGNGVYLKTRTIANYYFGVPDYTVTEPLIIGAKRIAQERHYLPDDKLHFWCCQR